MIYGGGKIIHCAKKLALQFGQINNNGQYINIKLKKYHVSEQMICLGYGACTDNGR